MEIVLAILLGNLHPKAVPIKDLAAEIVWVSAQAGVDAEIVARIIVVESAGRANAYNEKTNDVGLMQLNLTTMKRYGISMKCAKNWKCNLKMGVRILKDMEKYSGSKRPCHYNVGPKSLSGTRLHICLKYEQKLASL